MSEVIEQESTELVTLPARETALQVYSTAGGLDPLIEQIREKVAGTVYDMTTAKGRDECRSDAAKVGRSKQAIEKLGKTLSAEYKEIPKKIDAERRRAFEALEVLQAQVRQPLTEWEEAEQERVATHKHELAMLDGFSECSDLSADEIRANIDSVEDMTVGEEWEEFEAEAHRTKAKVLDAMRTALAAREKYEAEQAELAELRRKQAEQEQKDREARIAQEAAEKARQEAEAQAQAEREAAARREAQAKAAAEQAERDRLEAIERQKQAEARAEAEKLAAEQRAKDAAEAARLAEVKRQADEAARIAAETKAREADRAHKAKINGAALEAFIAGGMPEDCAKQAVTLIAKGLIPAITIHY